MVPPGPPVPLTRRMEGIPLSFMPPPLVRIYPRPQLLQHRTLPGLISKPLPGPRENHQRCSGADALDGMPLNRRLVERHHGRQLSSGGQTCRPGVLGSSQMHGSEGHDEERHQTHVCIPNRRWCASVCERLDTITTPHHPQRPACRTARRSPRASARASRVTPRPMVAAA
jgi:hypothetical protein